MFGVVPKVLWEKQKPADENNMIECACVSLIAHQRSRHRVRNRHWHEATEKRARQVALREPEGLLVNLKRLGIRPDEVDAVITTHLHWDHAGGLTRRNERGGLELTFKKARHFVQRSEWDFALHPDVRSQSGYLLDDFTPLADGNDLVEFLDGDTEVMPGVHLRHVGRPLRPGAHPPVGRAGVRGHQRPRLPNATLKVPWNMSADLEPLRVFEQKAKLFEEAQNHRWLLVLSHEPDQPAGYIHDDGHWQSLVSNEIRFTSPE
jgi:hypothetical protein